MKFLEVFPPIFDQIKTAYNPDNSRCAIHSGNIGDIIYSLPTFYELGCDHLILNCVSDPFFGNRALTFASARKLAPLLICQPNIRRLTIVNTQIPWEYADVKALGIDIVLDQFRKLHPGRNIHLVHWHSLPVGFVADATKQWLSLEDAQNRAKVNQKPYIVLSLTERYRSLSAAFYEGILTDVPPDQIFRIGQPEDLSNMGSLHGQYAYAREDFLELAVLIRNASLFIGNPSFPLALAEALKVTRLVEVLDGGNAFPIGPNGYSLKLLSQNEIQGLIRKQLGLPEPTPAKIECSIDSSESAKLLARIAQLENELTLVYTSKGWQLLRPARWLWRNLRAMLIFFK